MCFFLLILFHQLTLQLILDQLKMCEVVQAVISFRGELLFHTVTGRSGWLFPLN